jgi:MarR family transcriptional regulator, organic hydroperoxide resistance regulator
MALAKQKAPAAGPDEATKLDDFLCFAIYSANLAMNRINKPVLDELGLTYPQYIVLVALHEQDDQTVGGLGDKLFLDSSTLTPMLKRMEAMGHLTRQRDPEDERQVRVRLTPQGRSVRARALPFRGGLVKAIGLGAADFQHLREELVKLRANLSDALRAKP